MYQFFTLEVRFLRKTYSWFVFVCLCVFLGVHPQHLEVPRLGVELEPYPLFCATAIAAVLFKPHL